MVRETCCAAEGAIGGRLRTAPGTLGGRVPTLVCIAVSGPGSFNGVPVRARSSRISSLCGNTLIRVPEIKRSTRRDSPLGPCVWKSGETGLLFMSSILVSEFRVMFSSCRALDEPVSPQLRQPQEGLLTGAHLFRTCRGGDSAHCSQQGLGQIIAGNNLLGCRHSVVLHLAPQCVVHTGDLGIYRRYQV